jgi:hypothetical protein
MDISFYVSKNPIILFQIESFIDSSSCLLNQWNWSFWKINDKSTILMYICNLPWTQVHTYAVHMYISEMPKRYCILCMALKKECVFQVHIRANAVSHHDFCSNTERTLWKRDLVPTRGHILNFVAVNQVWKSGRGRMKVFLSPPCWQSTLFFWQKFFSLENFCWAVLFEVVPRSAD